MNSSQLFKNLHDSVFNAQNQYLNTNNVEYSIVQESIFIRKANLSIDKLIKRTSTLFIRRKDCDREKDNLCMRYLKDYAFNCFNTNLQK